MHAAFYSDQTTLRNTLRRVQIAPITDGNRQVILDFVTALEAEGISRLRIAKYVYHLTVIAKLLGVDFRTATKTDIVRVFAAIERAGYAAWTKKDFKAVCKRFYKWLRGGDDYPEEVRWIKCTLRGARRKLPEEMLSESEVARLVGAADNARDRALVFVLYESGCRIGEVGRLSIRQVEFDEFGARLIVNGKTGMRRIRIVGAAPCLATWLSVHPARQDPDAPLWVGLGPPAKGSALSYGGITRILATLTERAGIRKRVHPHLFRHSRATELASKLTEAQLKEMFGWTQSSTQPATYVHLSGRNVDDALLRLYGVRTTTETRESTLKSTRCPRCDTANACDAQHCQRCGLPTSTSAGLMADATRKTWDDRLAALVADPETVQFLLAKAARLGILLESPGK